MNLILITIITRERKQKQIWLNIYCLTSPSYSQFPLLWPKYRYVPHNFGPILQIFPNMWINFNISFAGTYWIDPAQEHIYLLMKKDSYPRFLRSEQYINLKEMAHNQPLKKRFVVLVLLFLYISVPILLSYHYEWTVRLILIWYVN